MSTPEFMRDVVRALELAGVQYMVVGSLSSNLYGIPRSTKDADFVVQFDNTPIREATRYLGPSYVFDDQMSFETATKTYRWKLWHPASAFMIELFLISDDPHDREQFSRRKSVRYDGHDVFVATAEDVVITKLRWSRPGKRAKDIDDVRSVITVSGAKLDWPYTRRWCAAHQTESLLNDVLKTILT